MDYNNMKRSALLKAILILGIILGSTGCSDNFLKTVPSDRLSSETFWKNEKDFNTALNGTYRMMTGLTLDIMYFDGITEIASAHADWIRQHEYVMGRANALSPWSAEIWEQLFTGITRANMILNHLKTLKDRTLSAETVGRIRGQALFLRGYFYHELLWMFGAAPIFKDVPSIDEARSVKRNSRMEVYTQIKNDLSKAASLLPINWPNDQYGRATRGAALGYLARASLYEASWQEYHEDNNSRAQKLYQTVIEMTQEVMALNEYSLYPNFRKIFTYEGEQNSGIIFDYQKVKGENGWDAWLAFAPTSMGGLVELAPTRELVKRFPMKDGLPIDESPMYNPAPPRITYNNNGNPTVATLGMYANRDPRLYATVLFPGAKFNGIIYNSYPPCASGAPEGYCSPTPDAIDPQNYNNTYTGYAPLKYVDPADEATPTNSGINIIKMRYAGILLMYAEAKIEVGELDESVNEVIEKIRNRVGIPFPYDITEMSQKEAIEFIRNERTIELAWEGLHLADIRRWATAEEIMPGPIHGIDVATQDGFETNPGLYIRKFKAPRDYLWPIPAQELNLNPNFTQNPGY